MSCGGYHTLVLTKDNELFGFGSNMSGECGNTGAKNLNAPHKITLEPVKRTYGPTDTFMMDHPEVQPSTVNIKAFSAGGKHSMVLTVDGNLYTFGYG